MLDVFIALMALPPSVMLGVRLLGDGRFGLESATAVFISAICVAVLSVTKAIRTRRREKLETPWKEPRELVAQAKSLHKALDEIWEPATDFRAGDLRITMLRVEYDRAERSPEALEQMIRYVGGRGGQPGRKMSARSGVAGYVARTGDLIWWSWEPILAEPEARTDAAAKALADFREHMVAEWGYSKSEALELQADRRAWIAAPIFDADAETVIAVLYLDACIPRVFDGEDVQEKVYSHAKTLAEVVQTCYSSGDGR